MAAKFHMHNLFLTDTVDEQIHIMKPGTSSLTLTQRCTTKAKPRGAVAAFRATLTSSERPNINIIALNIISCGEKFFFLLFFFKMVSPGSLRHLSSLTHRCWPAELQHGHSPSVLSVMNSLPQKTYLSRNTSHKVSFSCHCYISDTQQDSPDAHRQSVEMLRPLIHRNRKRKK